MSESNSKMDTFNKYTNVRYVLDSLNKGGIIRQVFGRFVKVYSVIAGLALLSLWIKTFSALEYMEFFQGAALLIWQIFFPVAAFLCLKAVFLRGRDITKLPDSEFVVSPIIALFITLHGEIAFIFLGIMSIPATLLVWLSASFIIPVETGDGFWSGIVTFVGFWIVGFLFYCITRWIREWTMALFSIAQNVDLIRQTKNEKVEQGSGGNG